MPGYALRGRGLRLPLLLIAALCLVGACNARRATRLIVRYKKGHVAAAAAGTGGMHPVAPLLNMFTLEVEDGSTLEDKAKQLAGMSGVLYAELDHWVTAATRDFPDSSGQYRGDSVGQYDDPKPRRTLLAQTPPPRSPPPAPRPRPPPPTPRPPPAAPVTPNDPYFGQQWGAGMINAPQAWTVTSNATSIRVCLIDTGVKWDHPDLIANLVPQSKAYKQANRDDSGHGTIVAGIVGAVGNNGRGVAGTALQASLLVCKALTSQNDGQVSDVVRCIEYCRKNKARVINASFNTVYSNALRDAFQTGTQAGVFFSSAAGNLDSDNDVFPTYPASFGFNGSVAVANVGANGRLGAGWDNGPEYIAGSNYGKRTVQLAAPGQNILSTFNQKLYKGNFYKFENGTSMSAPFVSGAAALALAASGGRLTNVQLQKMLISTARRLPALKGKVVSNGVLDLHALLLAATAAGKSGV